MPLVKMPIIICVGCAVNRGGGERIIVPATGLYKGDLRPAPRDLAAIAADGPEIRKDLYPLVSKADYGLLQFVIGFVAVTTVFVISSPATTTSVKVARLRIRIGLAPWLGSTCLAPPPLFQVPAAANVLKCLTGCPSRVSFLIPRVDAAL